MRSSLLLPLLAGLGAGVFALYSLVSAFEESKKQASIATETVEVVVAKIDIPFASKIDAGMLRTIKLPKPSPIKHAIESVDTIAGRVAAMRIVEGAPVLSTMLAAKNTPPGAQYQIPGGFRSVSVMAAAHTVELLNPGDFVDVLYAGRKRKTGLRQSRPILTNVEVYAVADKVKGMSLEVPKPEKKSKGKKKSRRTNVGQSSRPKTGNVSVKLLLPFKDAEMITSAMHNGDISLMQRAFGDDTPVNVVSLTFGEVETNDEDPKPAAVPVQQASRTISKPVYSTVKVLQGGEARETKFQVGEVEVPDDGANRTAAPNTPRASNGRGYVPDLVERAAKASRERKERGGIGD